MFINSITAPTSVWTAATRSLTADPATDAGAAALVWARAARSLTVQGLGLLTDEGANISATSSATQGVLGAYVQVVASTAHTVRAVMVTVADSTGVASEFFRIVIGTGASSSEVAKATIRHVDSAGVNPMTYTVFLDETVIPKGTRVAVAVANDTSAIARQQSILVQLQEKND